MVPSTELGTTARPTAAELRLAEGANALRETSAVRGSAAASACCWEHCGSRGKRPHRCGWINAEIDQVFV